MIQLERPLIFIDIESTGVDREQDKIVELCLCKLFPDGKREIKTNRYNPGIPIPAGATEVHKITDADVAGKPFFKQHAKAILDWIEGCDIAGFNSNSYDCVMLFHELSRAGLYWDYTKVRLIDVGNIFKIKEPRTLTAAVKMYCGKDHEEAHGAEADVLATLEVFEKQLERYEDLPQTLDELCVFSNFDKQMLDLSGRFVYDKDGVILLNFGKYKGQPAKDCMDFLNWMVYKANFSEDSRRVAISIMEGTSDTPITDQLFK